MPVYAVVFEITFEVTVKDELGEFEGKDEAIRKAKKDLQKIPASKLVLMGDWEVDDL